MKKKLKFKENVAYYCKSKSIALKLLNILHENGYEWINGESLKETTHYKKDIYYIIRENKEISYSTDQEYINTYYKIVNAYKFLGIKEEENISIIDRIDQTIDELEKLKEELKILLRP